MIVAVDSSVLIASLIGNDSSHKTSVSLLEKHKPYVLRHALLETFSTLTGGKLGFRMSADQATELIQESILPWVKTVDLDDAELIETMSISQNRGVRGGAIYDFLHLRAAQKIGAKRFYTKDVNDFKSIQRNGDPEIFHP